MSKPIYSFLLALFLFSCNSNKKEKIKIFATPIPHAQMLEFIKPELESQGIELEINMSDDYNLPNRAVADGEADANFFQHLPFMKEQIKQFSYPIKSIAEIEIEPMGVYSKKINNLSQLKEKDIVAIPNDPSNEERALLLLRKENLIELSNRNKGLSTLSDIIKNPLNLKFIEIDPAMIPRSLQDVTIAIMNTNYALEAGFYPKTDALCLEEKDSPYVNILAVHADKENDAKIKALKSAMTSEKMKNFIIEKYEGNVIPVF